VRESVYLVAGVRYKERPARKRLTIWLLQRSTRQKNLTIVELEITRKYNVVAIRARAEETIRRSVLTIEAWMMVCLMARNHSPLIKTELKAAAKCKVDVTIL